MILQVFSVFDKTVNAFLQPFYCRSKGEAIRSFSEAVNDGSKPFGKYASDYFLASLGEFDDVTGLFLGGEPSRVIGAHEVLSDELFTPGKELPNGKSRGLPM